MIAQPTPTRATLLPLRHPAPLTEVTICGLHFAPAALEHPAQDQYPLRVMVTALGSPAVGVAVSVPVATALLGGQMPAVRLLPHGLAAFANATAGSAASAQRITPV